VPSLVLVLTALFEACTAKKVFCQEGFLPKNNKNDNSNLVLSNFFPWFDSNSWNKEVLGNHQIVHVIIFP